MAYYPDALTRRVKLIGEAIAPSGVYRWDGYTVDEELVAWQNMGDDTASFGRTRVGLARVEIASIVPARARDIKKSDLVVIGSEMIDAKDSILRNYRALPDGEPLTEEYEAVFAEERSEGDAILDGLEQAIAFTFKIGTNDAAAVQAELEVSSTTTIKHERTKTKEESKSESRSDKYILNCAPGLDVRFWGTRQLQRARRIITGYGDVEHSIHIGRRDRKRKDCKTKGKGWHWHGKSAFYNTFQDFLLVIKGQAPASWDCADHFRLNPAPDRLITELEKPIDLPFSKPVEFNSVTKTELDKEILRIAPWLREKLTDREIETMLA